ncbi:sensor histidine kinase [Kitasatospora sp. MMS16-BH015]|uniref:sensor histidine kinase n=1 Tax=Kitasatospora sp. MMS16-BH015 TaxID=2018025 RepID=UPI000CA0E066|nr:histidine kinase [Kitasatospora sp. MMS16-BH015]AUG76419.1 sensor histidine kinase [Kitasatospora sp. MMS16-BH015]
MSGLFGRRAVLRWVHLVLGGALLMPYWFLSELLLHSLPVRTGPVGALALQLLGLPVGLVFAVFTALVPMVRALEGTAARALCGSAAAEELSATPAHSWDARRRTALWYVLHLGLGGIISGLSLSVPPLAAVLIASGAGVFGPPAQQLMRVLFGGWRPPGVLLGLLLLLGLFAVVTAAGALLARCAPALLGPTPAERLAAAERRALELAHRNRLARELHDSVGHALSAVTIQAAAARRTLATDPAFTAEALAAIEETARAAVAELDTVLGLLREDPPEAASHEGGGAATTSGAAGSGRARRGYPARGWARPGPTASAQGAATDHGGATSAHAPATDRATKPGVVGEGGETGPTLAALEVLLRSVRLAGATVEVEAVPAELAGLAPGVSREAYRIVQEGLTNVLRHAGPVAVRLRLAPADGWLRVELTNPLGPGRPSRPGGGRGLRGIAERATALRGSYQAGPQDGHWQLAVALPLPQPSRRAP